MAEHNLGKAISRNAEFPAKRRTKSNLIPREEVESQDIVFELKARKKGINMEYKNPKAMMVINISPTPLSPPKKISFLSAKSSYVQLMGGFFYESEGILIF